MVTLSDIRPAAPTDPQAACARRIARGGWYEDVVLHRCQFPIGPYATWTNVAYPLAGLVGVWADPTPTAWAMLAALTILGAGSFVYHGFKTVWANRLDWLGIWAVFAALAVHPIAPDWKGITLVMLAAATAGALLLTYAFRQIGANMLIGVLLVLGLLPVFWSGGWGLGLASLACFLAGKFWWTIGTAALNPAGLLLVGGLTRALGPTVVHWLRMVGHGNWHIATAGAFLLAYLAQLALRTG